MKFIIAPDSFKGSLTALQFCQTAEKEIKKSFPASEIITMPLADGGEGSLECIANCVNGYILETDVTGAFAGETVHVEVLLFTEALSGKKTAVIETAMAMGLPLVEGRKNPLLTTTYGAGQMILFAIQNGAEKIILTLGGSSTNDCGAGLLCALGAEFRDKNNNCFIPTGGTLEKIHHADFTVLEKNISGIEFSAMCDVKNPLCGKKGASYVYGPQKGADEKTVRLLDEGCAHFAETVCGKNKLLMDSEGAGAAGGLGFAAIACLHGKLIRGIDVVLDLCGFETKLENCDYVLTGEGCFDLQSIMGKTIGGLNERLQKKSGCNAKLVLFCGKNKVEDLSEWKTVESVNEISTGQTSEYALSHAQENLEKSTGLWCKKIAEMRNLNDNINQ